MRHARITTCCCCCVLDVPAALPPSRAELCEPRVSCSAGVAPLAALASLAAASARTTLALAP